MESPGRPGLGRARPARSAPAAGVKHPQMQWNALDGPRRRRRRRPLARAGRRGPWVYFVHSFAPPVGARDAWRSATTAVRWPRWPTRGPLWGAQFHPEKSGATGSPSWPTSSAGRWPGVMELLPAIDLRGGGAVRLTQGDFDREVRYGDPVELAAALRRGRRPLGARRRPRRGAHRACPTSGPCWTRSSAWPRTPPSASRPAGGVRTEDDVRGAARRRAWHGWCSARSPSRTPPWRRRCARRWPGQVAVGLDYRVGADGWPRPRPRDGSPGSGRAVTDLLALWEGEPIGAVVVTSVARDGMLSGPDLDGLPGAPGGDVVAGGGIGWRVGHRGPRGPGRGCGASGRAVGRRDRGQGHRRGAPDRRGGTRRVRSVRRDPLPRRHRGPGRQGRALRRPHRRGRPRRAGRALRRRGGRRGHLPRHHGLLRRARHHGLGGRPHGRAGLHPLDGGRWRPGGGRRTPPPPGRGGQGRGEHGRSRATRAGAGDRGRVRRPVRRGGD